MLKLDLEYYQNILFVRFRGNLNNKTIKKIDSFVIPIIEKHNIKKVIINLKDIVYISESGVDAILKIKCTLKKIGGVLLLTCATDDTKSYLGRLHIKNFDSESDAIKRLEVF